MRAYFFVALVVLGFASGITGQRRNLLFHHLKVQDGLSQAKNSFVYKDSKGFVWISSVNGLNRFDGLDVKVYLPDKNDSTSLFGENIQSNFFEDANTDIWFTTYEGLNYYERRNDCFHHFTISDSTGNSVLGYIAFHLDGQNNLWLIIGNNAVYTFNILNKEFRFIHAIYKGSYRAKVISVKDNLISRLWVYRPTEPGIQELLVGSDYKIVKDELLGNGTGPLFINPNALLVDNDSIVWIATRDILIKYNLKNNRTEKTDVPGILNMAHLNDSSLIIAIFENGIMEFNKWRKIFTQHYLPDISNPLSLLKENVIYISKDRDEGLWFCSDGFGLSYAYPEKSKFDLVSPATQEIKQSALFNPNGFVEAQSEKLWCSTYFDGIYVLERDGDLPGNEPAKKTSEFFKSESIYGIFEDSQQNIWISAWAGLFVYEAETQKIIQISDKFNIMLSGTELHDGRIIFCALNKGLFQVIKSPTGKYSLFKLNNIPPDKNYIPIWQDKKDRIWINEELQKLLVLDPTTFKVIAEIPVNGICTKFIESGDRKTIWVSSTTGLYEIYAGDLTVSNVYKETDGFNFNGVSAMLADKSGNLWFSSSRGIVRFDPQTKEGKIYTAEDGLPAYEFNKNASYQFSDGEMWFGSMSGITSFYPDQIKNIEITAIPQITEILVNDSKPDEKLICEETSASNVTEIRKLTFNYKHSTLSFMLKALEYSAPKLNRVRYKLEGIDENEVETSSGSLIRYASLPAGSYKLVVYASNSDGMFNPVPRTLDIVITPPFYKTWWFISLVILAGMGLVAFIVYLQFSKVLALQKVRLKLYENLHDDVGSRLTAIVLTAEDVQKNKQPDDSKINSISNIAKGIVNNMRRLVWAMDPENDRMQNVVQKLNYDRAQILDEKIAFTIEIDSKIKNIIIPGETRYQISSIFNEALNNISKYAKAANVHVQFLKEDGYLKMIIVDDGMGFNAEDNVKKSSEGTGYGLSNMERRAARVKGNFKIHSKPGEGTRIEVSFPVS